MNTARAHGWTVNALAALLLLMAAYGIVSLPSLAARWGVSVRGVVLFGLWAALAAWLLRGIVRPMSRAALAAFAVVAIALRIGSALLVAGRTSPGDAQVYLDLARALLGGHGLVVRDDWLGIAVHAFYPPLYPLVLAGWGAVAGLSTGSLLLLSGLIDLCAAAALVALARRLGQPRAGYAAAALYLIWPATLAGAPLAQKEGLGILLALWLAVAWCDVRGGAGWRRGVPVGVATGLLALTQPGWGTLGLAFGLAMMPTIGWRRVMRVGIPAAAVAVAVMLPWWLRNALALGAFVPLTSAAGLSLWVGNNPAATGRWMQYPAVLRGLPELEVARVAGGMARAWILDHPAAFVRLTLGKAIRAIGLGQSGVGRIVAMRPSVGAGVSALLLPLAQGAQTALLTAAALAVRSTPNALLLAVVLQLLLVDVWFEFDERHRDVLTPFLLLAATMAVSVRRRTVPAAPASAPPAA